MTMLARVNNWHTHCLHASAHMPKTTWHSLESGCPAVIRSWLTVSTIVALVAVTSSCSSSAAPPASPVPVARLWGDLKPVVSVKELMRDMIDPLADNIFDAVGVTLDANGAVERMPRSEEDWERIRIGATTLAEGAYLLKVVRPFAPAGDLNESIGPEAVELSPDQILAKLEKDPVEWNARIEALHNVGLEVLDIVKRRDAKELWDAAENLDAACENCHRSYWYPGETPEFYSRLDRRLSEMRAATPGQDRHR